MRNGPGFARYSKHERRELCASRKQGGTVEREALSRCEQRGWTEARASAGAEGPGDQPESEGSRAL